MYCCLERAGSRHENLNLARTFVTRLFFASGGLYGPQKSTLPLMPFGVFRGARRYLSFRDVLCLGCCFSFFLSRHARWKIRIRVYFAVSHPFVRRTEIICLHPTLVGAAGASFAFECVFSGDVLRRSPSPSAYCMRS